MLDAAKTTYARRRMAISVGEAALQMDQSPLQRYHYGLGTVTGVQAPQDDAYVAFHCSLGDTQIVGNLSIGLACCHQSEHLAFAVAEA